MNVYCLFVVSSQAYRIRVDKQNEE